MAWSIADVARMSGVTSRTLRHYDEIGLLPPAWIGGNGYRHYEEDDLLRLQQILVLRELGLGLTEIAEVLDHQVDEVEALRAHHKRLLMERDRLAILAGTVERTIAELVERKDSNDMPKINKPENLFEGFDASRHDAQARERWPAQWEQSRQFVDTLTPQDHQRMQRETTAQMIRMAEFMAAGTPADDPGRAGRGRRPLPGCVPVLDAHCARVQGPGPDLRRRPTVQVGLRQDHRRPGRVPA
jgi:DNA-binding transcriptional MerR regulator